MSPQSSPSWSGSQSWAAGSRRRFGHPNPDLRVSDAERADVADRLSKHYGDGRLDQAEFNERMERAMNAKTQGDFAGLFTDLPDLAEPGATPPAPVSHQPSRSNSPMSRIAMLVLIIVAAVVVSHLVFNSFFFPWLLIALVAFLWLRHHERNHHRA